MVKPYAGRVRAGSSPYVGPALTPRASVEPPLLADAPVETPHRGASLGRRMAGFRPRSSGPNTVVAASGPELIKRSRDTRRNNPHGKRALNLYATHIVGTGVRPRFLCSNAKVRKTLTDLFDRWAAVADADGVLDFYGLQALAVSEVAEAGEIFGRLRARRLEDGLPVPLQIQLIPAEQVPYAKMENNGENSILQGIERTPFGARTAYWIHPANPVDLPLGANPFTGNFPVRVPAADVLHMYQVDRIGQLRGLPWLAAAITTLHQINDYMDAELLRKQMVAALVGFVKKEGPEDTILADAAAAMGSPGVLPEDPLAVSLEPGTMQYLEPGEDVSFTQPGDVSGSFEAFVSANYRAVAAAADQLYEELTGDWKNANDRTFRAQFNTFKRRVRQWQYSMLCVQFNAPIVNRFVDYAVASGALVVPKSVSDADLRRVSWNPERWEYIQPVQDIEATGEAISLGLTSRQAEVAERGDDIEQIDDQIAKDKEREKALGLSFGPSKGGAKPPAPPPAAKE